MQRDYDDYDYKLKYNGQALNVKNSEDMGQLFQETDILVNDTSKNEKLAVQFRALEKQKDIWELLDISEVLTGFQDQLLSSDLIKQWAGDYVDYVKEKHPSKDLQIEVVKVYIPLDKENKTENILDEGHFVHYFKKDPKTGKVSSWVRDFVTGNGKIIEYTIPLKNEVQDSISKLRDSYDDSEQKHKIKLK